MKKKLLAFILVAAFAVFAWLSLPGLDQARAPGAGPQTASGTGLVLHIERDKGVVTVRHDAIPALNMMAMTMSYPVRDRSQLANLQAMQKIGFRLTYDGGDYVITEIK